MGFLSRIWGGVNEQVRQAIREGGKVIDLRTAYEFDQGHIPGALNIPVDRIRANILRIQDIGKPIILCCGNGTHCREAIGILKEAGIPSVINGGRWESVWKAMRN